MYSFNYQQAKGLADAAKVLAKDSDAKLLAGGQSLIAAMKLRLAHPSEVIDLGTIKDLSGIKVDSKAVAIGAMTRHAEVASSAAVKKAIPALANLAGGIGDRMVRNMGTIGGSLANNDPAADYPAAVLALGATIVTNKRKIAADAGSGVRVAVTGAAPSVFRVAAMEKALAAKFAPESVANIAVPEKGLNSDLHAKADYRAHLVTVMAKRAVEAAMK